MKLTIEQSSQLSRLLADPSRLRLLLLMEAQALSIAELTEVTGLAQSRVSTHLARLRKVGLVQDQRTGSAALYALNPDGGDATGLWRLLRDQLDDPQARLDRERAEMVVRARKTGQTWAESVAGRMELHYSPGRTWEATARALIGLLDLGDVLDLASGDGVLAELLASHARTVTCVDISAKVLGAARRRLAAEMNVFFCRADMAVPTFADQRFDQVFLMHALTFAKNPRAVLQSTAKLLRPRGQLIVATLNAHQHQAARESYDHVNLGTTPETLQKWLVAADLQVEMCRITSRDPRPPYFEVVTALARKT